jgi:hypothetical protein
MRRNSRFEDLEIWQLDGGLAVKLHKLAKELDCDMLSREITNFSRGLSPLLLALCS